jgi:hypothetical protein
MLTPRRWPHHQGDSHAMLRCLPDYAADPFRAAMPAPYVFERRAIRHDIAAANDPSTI